MQKLVLQENIRFPSVEFIFFSSDSFLQGFNSGIVLYDLKKMRESVDYTENTKVENMLNLSEKFMFAGSVGKNN